MFFSWSSVTSSDPRLSGRAQGKGHLFLAKGEKTPAPHYLNRLLVLRFPGFQVGAPVAARPVPDLLTPGTEFSNEADPTVTLEAGVHYIRLWLRNEQEHDVQTSGVEACGMVPADFKRDFVERRIEVRDEPN